MRSSSTSMARRGQAFTLVELLVVIGIIALLISILLPSLNRARESARRVKCLSNMRQIVVAMQMFAQDNKGSMPARASTTTTIRNNNGTLGNSSSQAQSKNSMNWISYNRKLDPLTGRDTGVTVGDKDDQNITYSGLAKYLGSKQQDHTSSTGANQISPQLESLFRCPSDQLDGRFNDAPTPTGQIYRYSYSANDNYVISTKNNGTGQGYNTGGPGLPAPYNDGGYATVKPWARNDGNFTGKLASIHNAADKIILFCQDPSGMEDGCFTANPYNLGIAGGTDQMDQLSGKHDSNKAATKSKTSGAGGYTDVSIRGNVVMMDGHGDFMPRREAFKQIHTGNPFPDPAALN
ncbi:MAG: DUF1559 domain-containing protein [Tepidisphaeraceae bacterium]